jgi:hypothetical protein
MDTDDTDGSPMELLLLLLLLLLLIMCSTAKAAYSLGQCNAAQL